MIFSPLLKENNSSVRWFNIIAENLKNSPELIEANQINKYFTLLKLKVRRMISTVIQFQYYQVLLVFDIGGECG